MSNNQGIYAFFAVEALLLAGAVALWIYGSAPWWMIPLSLLIAPVLGVVAIVVALAVAQSRGENPFQ